MIDSLLKALRSNKPYVSSRSIYVKEGEDKVTIFGKRGTVLTIKKDWRTEKIVITKIEPNYCHVFNCMKYQWSIVNDGTLLCLRMMTKKGCYPYIQMEI